MGDDGVPSAGWVGEQLALARHKLGGAINALRQLDRLTSTEGRSLNVQVDDLLAEVERLKGAYQRLVERTQVSIMRPQG